MQTTFFLCLLKYSLVSTAPKELREVDLTAKMSKSKKKKLKKRAKRNQQLMDETMQHIVEKEQEEVEGQQAASIAKGIEKGESELQEVTAARDQQQHSNTEIISPDKKKDNAIEKDANGEIEPVTNTEMNGQGTNTHKVNGTSQNGGTVHGVTNCQNIPILDELEDIDEDDCDDVLHESCKVDGKFPKS
jgi:hypothetical protein